MRGIYTELYKILEGKRCDNSSGETCVVGRIILKRNIKKMLGLRLDSTVQNIKDCRNLMTL